MIKFITGFFKNDTKESMKRLSAFMLTSTFCFVVIWFAIKQVMPTGWANVLIALGLSIAGGGGINTASEALMKKLKKGGIKDE